MSQGTDPDGRALLDGVVVPLATAIDAAGRPDPIAARNHLQKLGETEVTHLLLLGTNGEGPAFDDVESAQFSAEVAATWRARIGVEAVVLVAAYGSSTRETIRRAETLLESADALVVPPRYYFHYQPDELISFYRDDSSLGSPVVIYNSPHYTGNPITEPVLQAVAEIPGVVGMKDSGGDDDLLLAAIRIAEARPGFAVSQGNERRLAWALVRGTAGITPGLANIAPEACTEMVSAVRAAVTEKVSALQAGLDALGAMHRIRPGVACMKAALAILGLSDSPPAHPTRAYSADESAALRTFLADVPVTLLRGRVS
jgi:dihydrodipicolinate synthase/N-acetylneuraminate lyase